jgi:uncharacterized protein
MHLHKLHAYMSGAPDVDHPKPERLLIGNPKRETWNVTESLLGNGLVLYSGVWRCEPGKWRIQFASDEHELFTVLVGRCTVSAQDGSSSQTASAGEALFIAPGFAGTFEVHELMTKTYAIVARDG